MKKLALLLTFFLAFSPLPAKAATTPIDSSSVGVQLFMWNWKSVAKECKNELGPAGYDWVLVMPPSDHLSGPQWWVHYQPNSYEISSRLGSRADFAQMVEDCKAAGVKVIADAVINHMVGVNSGTSWTGAQIEKYTHPGLYQPADFHSQKENISSWGDLNQVQNYELLGLSDLATEKTNVREKIATYLNDLLSIGVYGFRIDAARHIPVADLRAIKALLPSKTYFLQEVAADSNPDINDYLETGDVWEFDWVNLMSQSFGQPGTAHFMTSAKRGFEFIESKSAVTMVSNHDTERNNSAISVDMAQAQQLAFIYTLASDYGKPMVYSGYSFMNSDSSPKLLASGAVANAVCPSGSATPKATYKDLQFTCQHRWKGVEAMIAWRDSVGNAAETGVKGTKGVLSFGRGTAGHVVMNSNLKTTKVKIKTQMAAGKYCDLITGGRNASIFPKQCLGATVVVDRAGYISASVAKQTAIAITKDSVQR